MSQFSWKMLETVPPMVSETISDTRFSKDWHEKELSPEWNEELVDYSLVYYRPVLFFSYEGKVSQKGWVGNIPVDSKNDKATADECCNRSYKKPCLKVKQITSMHSASEQASFDSNPTNEFVQLAKPTTPVQERVEQISPDSLLFGLRKYS